MIFVRDVPIHWDYDYRVLSPILTYCRPCEPSLGGIDLASYDLDSTPTPYAKRMCYVLRPSEEIREKNQRSFWVDPSRGYIVLRITQGRFGFPPLHCVDIGYRQTEDDSWIPSIWTVTVTGGREEVVLFSETAIVTHGKLNVDISDSEFSLESLTNTHR